MYSIPGLKLTGIPLPTGVLKAIRLSDLEEIAAQISAEHKQPVASDGSEKENAIGTSSKGKRRALQPASSLPSKQVRTVMKPLQMAPTTLVV